MGEFCPDYSQRPTNIENKETDVCQTPRGFDMRKISLEHVGESLPGHGVVDVWLRLVDDKALLREMLGQNHFSLRPAANDDYTLAILQVVVEDVAHEVLQL